jgi:hypothetical protein
VQFQGALPQRKANKEKEMQVVTSFFFTAQLPAVSLLGFGWALS